LETVRRFRSYVIRLSAAATAALTIAALIFDRVVAGGLLIGGLAGTAAFFLMTRFFEVANASEIGVKSRTRTWSASRFLLYAVALYAGYILDTVHARGFLAAAAGLFIVRLAVIVVGIAGWDLRGSAPADSVFVVPPLGGHSADRPRPAKAGTTNIQGSSSCSSGSSVAEDRDQNETEQ